MKIQKYDWSCGPAAVSNALRCFGIKVAEDRIIGVANTVPESRCPHCRQRRVGRGVVNTEKDCIAGTNEMGVKKALRKFGKGLKIEERDWDVETHAWAWLNSTLAELGPVILNTHNTNHWCLATGILGDSRVIVFDSDPSKSNRRENGVRVLDKDDLMRVWKASYKGVKSFYGIAVFPGR